LQHIGIGPSQRAGRQQFKNLNQGAMMKPRILVMRMALAGVVTLAGFGLARLDTAVIGNAHAESAAAPSAAIAPVAAQNAASAATITLPNFTSLVKRYGPAVVNITVTEKTRQTGFSVNGMPSNGDDPFSQFFRGFPMPFNVPHGGGNFGGGQVVHGVGSGFIVSPDGYIMTNAHVVQDASEVTVRLTDRREYRAKVIGSDKVSDIAVIKIDGKNLPVVTVGNADALQVGEWVLAIGSPYNFDNTVTSGIVSAKARMLPSENYVPFIQTDVPVNPGNSGGPLFNMNGEVVGINSQIYSETGGFQGLSFAIPINIAMHVKDELVAHGKVTRGRLGVSIQEVNQQLANSFGLPRPMGALVSEVAPDGPAASSGLKSGDIITSIDGKEIERSGDLPSFVAELKPGSRAELQVWRGGKPTAISVTLGELSDGKQVALANTEPDHGRLGLGVRTLQPQERAQIGADGLVVQSVSGPAEAADIRRGDVIVSVNGVPVKTVEQLRSVVTKAGTTVAVLLIRDGTRMFVPIDLG
jgi:serine protease Do